MGNPEEDLSGDKEEANEEGVEPKGNEDEGRYLVEKKEWAWGQVIPMEARKVW